VAQLVLGLPSVLGIRVVRENVTGYMIESAFVAVAVIGLLHGLEPGHGWPVAMLYAARSSRPLLRRFVSSWIIASAHLVSSLAIVGPFALLRAYGGFALPYVNYIAGGALVAMAAKLFLEKPKDGLEDQHGHIHDSFTGDHEHEHKHPDGEKHMHRHSRLRPDTGLRPRRGIRSPRLGRRRDRPLPTHAHVCVSGDGWPRRGNSDGREDLRIPRTPAQEVRALSPYIVARLRRRS